MLISFFYSVNKIQTQIFYLKVKDLACVWILYFRNVFYKMHFCENTFSRMHFIKNSAFGKILKLFIRSDYAENNCVWLVF